jgi:hypothetical protein
MEIFGDFHGVSCNFTPYHLVFVLKEHMIFAVTCSLTLNLLYEICSQVNNIILREVKQAKVTSKFATPLSVGLFLCKGFHSKAPLYYIVLHIHGQKYTLHHCTKPSVKVNFMFTHKQL